MSGELLALRSSRFVGTPRGVRADLPERALPAGEPGRARWELAATDRSSRGTDPIGRPLGLVGRGPAAGHEAGLEEAQLDTVGQAPARLQMGQRVDVELQALPGAFVGGLLVAQLARLEVDDRVSPAFSITRS